MISNWTQDNMNDYILYNELGRGAHTTVYKGRKKGQIDFVAICSYEKEQQKYVHNKVKKRLLGRQLLSSIV